MSHILLDTHVWAWSLTTDARLSSGAITAIEAADSVSVSAISLYEIGQKIRLGKWPEMATHFPDLIRIAEHQGARLLPISPEVCAVASVMNWAHRDPFDRFIGATALLEGLVLISADTIFDDLASEAAWRGRLW